MLMFSLSLMNCSLLNNDEDELNPQHDDTDNLVDNDFSNLNLSDTLDNDII